MARTLTPATPKSRCVRALCPPWTYRHFGDRLRQLSDKPMICLRFGITRRIKEGLVGPFGPSSHPTRTDNEGARHDADGRRQVSRVQPQGGGEPREGEGVQGHHRQGHAGKWQVLFFWPMDFTFICPTEIAEFGKQNAEFLDARRPGPRREHRHPLRPPRLAARTIRTSGTCRSRCWPTPSASCPPSSASSTRSDGVPLRATFIVDPEGIIRWASVNDLSVGRNVAEVLRVLDASADRRALPLQLEEG